jgi:hypothetical protein
MTHFSKRFADFWWGEGGLSALLLLVFATLFLAPFFDSMWLRTLSALFFSLLLISGVAYIAKRPLLRWITGAIAMTAIAMNWLQEFWPGRGLAIASSLISLLCLVALTLVVLARVFRQSGPVTGSRVQGAIAAYVLFGVTWSILYRALDLCLPAAFSVQATAGMPAATVRENFTYFSFVTLTTLGYGDITAVHPVARMFVVFQALVGQLYPATLLARLVSLEISQRQAPQLPPQGES